MVSLTRLDAASTGQRGTRRRGTIGRVAALIAVVGALAGCVPLPPSMPTVAPPAPSTAPDATETAPSVGTEADGWVQAMESEPNVHGAEWKVTSEGTTIITVEISSGISRDELQGLYESAYTHAEDFGVLPAFADCSCSFVTADSRFPVVKFEGDMPDNVDLMFDGWEWASTFTVQAEPTVDLLSSQSIALRFEEPYIPELVEQVVEGGPAEQFFDAGISVRGVGDAGGSYYCSWMIFRSPITAAERDVLLTAYDEGLAGHADVCPDFSVAPHGWMIYNVADPETATALPDAIAALRDQLAAAGATVS